MHRHTSFVVLLLLSFGSPVFAETKSPIQERADRFLKLTNAGYQSLYQVNGEAQWLAVTDVKPEHDAAAEATGKAYAAFNGNPALITEARELLAHEKELNELTIRELKQLLLNAAEGPMTNPDLVAKRVAAETKQASLMNGFGFKLNGQKITANQIDDKLEKSTDLTGRKAVWEASKEIGPVLKPNLVTLRDRWVSKLLTVAEEMIMNAADFKDLSKTEKKYFYERKKCGGMIGMQELKGTVIPQ